MGFALKRPDDAVGSAAPAIMIGLFVAFGGVLFGYVPKFYTPIPKDTSNDHLDMTQVPSVVSSP
jgi:hypothetical protein